MDIKIISGAQTGADRGALDAAMQEGILTGGYCPKGRKAEDGKIDECYNLKETTTSDYRERTKQNILSSHGTIVFTFGKPSGGSALTIAFARGIKRPVLHLDLEKRTPEECGKKIDAFVFENNLQIVNIAGQRESKAKGIYDKTKTAIRTWLNLMNGVNWLE